MYGHERFHYAHRFPPCRKENCLPPVLCDLFARFLQVPALDKRLQREYLLGLGDRPLEDGVETSTSLLWQRRSGQFPLKTITTSSFRFCILSIKFFPVLSRNPFPRARDERAASTKTRRVESSRETCISLRPGNFAFNTSL